MMSKLSGMHTITITDCRSRVNTKRPWRSIPAYREEIAGLNKAVPTGGAEKGKAFRDAGKPKTGMTPADLLILSLQMCPT